MNGFELYIPTDGSKGAMMLYEVTEKLICTDEKVVKFPNIMILADEFWACLRDCPNPKIEIKITNKWDDVDDMNKFLNWQAEMYKQADKLKDEQ